MDTTKIDRYWQQYRAATSADSETPDNPSGSFSFGGNPEDAREIARLVIAGVKTATGSLLWVYVADGESPPRAGDYWVITDGGENPICIIQDTDVQVIPYDQVTIDYAIDGGEGDLTMDSWREIYWDYILAECTRIRREPNEQVTLVMERFRLVYGEPLNDF